MCSWVEPCNSKVPLWTVRSCYSWNFQDFSQQPPAQELIARDLHDQEWHFRHIYRGEQCLNLFLLWITAGKPVCNLVGNFSFFSVCVQHTRSNEKFWSIPFLCFCRPTPQASSHYWVECICECQETASGRLCSVHTVTDCLSSHLCNYFGVCFVCFCPGHVHTDLLTGNTGMTKVSYCWELDVLTDSKWLCHHQYCPVIACILVSLLLPIMLQPQTAVSQYSTTQGWLQIIHALW
jgi:hypothetical protein